MKPSTSPYWSRLGVTPKTSAGVKITVCHKKLNLIRKLSQLPIPLVNRVLDSLGSERVLFLFALVSALHHTTARKGTDSLSAFSTPTGLHECLAMPQSNSASPGWFVEVINEDYRGLEQVDGYLDDAIVFDSDLVAHIRTIFSLFERLQRHNIKLFPLNG